MSLTYNPLLKIGLDDTGSGTSGGAMSIGGTVTSGTAGSVLFVGSGPVLAQDNANFFWDDTNNRLGIGTNTPSYALHVEGSNKRIFVKDPDGLGYAMLVVGNTSSNLYFGQENSSGGSILTGSSAHAGIITNSGAYPLQFGTTGSLRMTLTSGGILGVGTNDPSALKLQVATSSTDSATAPTTVTTSYYLKVGGQEYTTGSYRLIGFGYSTSSARLDTPAYIGSYETGSTGGTSADLVFGTRSVTTAVPATERMRILDTGEVGIGTSAPVRLLEVNLSDSATATVSYPLRLAHITSGTAAASFGTGIEFVGEDAGGGQESMASLETIWTNATNGVEDSDFVLKLMDDGTLTELIRVKGDTRRLGVATSAPDKALEVNSSTGDNLRLTYNDSDGSATNYVDFSVSSSGDLTVAPSGSDFNVTGRLAPTLGVTPRVVSTTDDATAVIDVTVTDVYELTAIANATTFSTTGTPIDGQRLTIRFQDAGTAKGLTWDAIFQVIGVTLPTTTVANKQHYVGCVYSSSDSKFHVLAVSVEA